MMFLPFGCLGDIVFCRFTDKNPLQVCQRIYAIADFGCCGSNASKEKAEQKKYHIRQNHFILLFKSKALPIVKTKTRVF